MSKRVTIFILVGVVLVGVAAITVAFEHQSSSTTMTIEPTTISEEQTAPTTTIRSVIAQHATSSVATSTPKALTRPLAKTTPAITTPTTTTLAATTTIATTTSTPDPAQITINPQSIVGILCYYNEKDTDEDTGQNVVTADAEEVRGSGVIINSEGDILTNRHIVEQPETDTSITDNNGRSVPVSSVYQLDHCDVGQLPAGATLPSASEIESLNPYINIPVLGYTAQPVYISQTAGLSNDEAQYADFALLKITGVSASGPTFGITSVPRSFPYATLLPTEPYPDIINSQVITYGFPGDVTSGQGNFFQTLTMTGSVGSVSNIYYGDQYYANTPLSIATDLAIAHGRSGSPLFWRGYVIGIVTFFIGNNQTDSGSVASDAILKSLRGTGYIVGD